MSSCVWPVRRNWQVILARFPALTCDTHHLKPLWFLNSRLVLSCWQIKCVLGKCKPCRASTPITKLSISVLALPSFFVSGLLTKYTQHRPWASRQATWHLAFWNPASSLPFITPALGISHLAWSIPSPITVTVWPRRRLSPRHSQYKHLSKYWSFRCRWYNDNCFARAMQWPPKDLRRVLNFKQCEHWACWESARKRR